MQTTAERSLRNRKSKTNRNELTTQFIYKLQCLYLQLFILLMASSVTDPVAAAAAPVQTSAYTHAGEAISELVS